jgi:hypothetical protein
MQVTPLEHPTIRTAIARIYLVSSQKLTGSIRMNFAHGDTGSRLVGFLLWIIIEDLEKGGEQRDCLVGV